MNSSDIEFLSAMELESLWQAEELNRSNNVTLEEVVESQMPLENMDLILTLLRVSDSELLRKDGMKGFMLVKAL